MNAIDYAKLACDTMMRKYGAADLPPKGKFHYHQGVFLSGMLNTYEICGEEKYFEYVREWVNSIIYEDGSIHDFDRTSIDDIQPGILLFPLYEKTKDERYAIAIETLMDALRGWKTNSVGGFWHKECHPNQMWLDSLYMGGPIRALYSVYKNDPSYLETAINQALIMYENMRDKETGMLFHAWDESKKEAWADKETGLSPEVWGRAFGWYVIALLDILSYTDRNNEKYEQLTEIERSLLNSVIKYQDKSGMWYQVVAKGGCKGNWLETSCSSLFSCAIARAVRMDILGKEYLEYAKKGFNGVVNSLTFDGDNLLLGGVCVGTGVLDYKGYIERPTSTNDLHGMGAFLLMCAEIAKI